MSSLPRTRFAPSPSGYLHIGGARTALFSHLYARRHGGTFVLRIEDTDRERSTDASIAAILESLEWLQITWDEGPFFQSRRTATYVAEVDRLLTAGKAYRCYCTTEELDAKRRAALAAGRKPAYDGTCRDLPAGDGASRPHTVRFRSPKDGETVIDDIVKGRVVFQNAEFDDLIILRTDGTPTYNFCVVVDDTEMRITHVLRGDDHLANTPRQILLYQALGAALPAFGHVPLILGTDKARLSKRHGAMAVTAYRDMGFLPDAVCNYLVRLGWSHGDQEIFSRAELIEKFNLEAIGKSAGVFDYEKMLWLNSHYLRALAPADLAAAARPFIARAGLAVPGDDAWLAQALATLQERAKTLVDLVEQAHFYLTAHVALDPAAAAKFLKPEIAPALRSLRDACATLDAWTVASLERAFEAVLAQHGLKLGKLAQPVRVAVTGTAASPGIFEVLHVLGRERTLARLDAALATLR
ncbi:MAG: glutamate--tRNA ligase [Deltaproteobacteria bacterium]|nr:glutamate--tRNA ligase [Deltaproteobacteria bacterium]